MSYENKKCVIEDCRVTDSAPGKRFHASYPNKLPEDLTVTFSTRGTFEVFITDTTYRIVKKD